MIINPSRIMHKQFRVRNNLVKDNLKVNNRLTVCNQYATILPEFISPESVAQIKMTFLGTMNVVLELESSTTEDIYLQVIAPLYLPETRSAEISYIDYFGDKIVIPPDKMDYGFIQFIIPSGLSQDTVFKITVK